MAQKWRSTRQDKKSATFPHGLANENTQSTADQSSQSTTRQAGRPSSRPKGMKLDPARLDRLALDYVARFATTSSKLQRYLSRKIMEARHAETIEDTAASSLNAQIPDIVARCVALGYVNDRAWAEMKALSLRASGYGERRVRDNLRNSGIPRELVDEIAITPDEGAGEDDAATESPMDIALRFARRHRIGPFRAVKENEHQIHQTLGKLVRAGHPFEIASKISRMSATDIDDN
jgi:regulatory protein